MSKKRNPLACPTCMTKLMEVTGHCEGVIITCPHCGASILADIDENGRMRLNVEPLSKGIQLRQQKQCAG